MSVIINHANTFIRNINNYLCEHNLNVVVDFIGLEDHRAIITTNQADSSQDMNIIEKCIKKSESINSEHVNSLWLPKSKLYLKILGFSYLVEGTNQPITSKIVTEAIQQMYIFKDITLTSKPYIIKVSSNSDSAVVWVNVWDLQNGSIAKFIINQCFNMRKYITTICDTNINLGVL